MNNLSNVNSMLSNISVLTVFKNFLTDNICEKFLVLLEGMEDDLDFNKIAELYTDFVCSLYNFKFRGNWSKYIENFIVTDENPVSVECAKGSSKNLPDFILGAFEFELRILSDIASIDFQDIKEVFLERYPDAEDTINSLPVFNAQKMLFTKDCVQKYYKKEGYGAISTGFAFKLGTAMQLFNVSVPDEISLDNLKLYDYQKNILLKNTEAFIRGKKANNVLLYGDRGCGKSSLVKAVANKYKESGLKIIQVSKENMSDLEQLSEYLAGFPSKFIIFIDDLVFGENDPMFSSCKALLEGSLAKHPENIIIYVTSNRKHLIKESFTSRAGDEVHLNDTMDESASLSDRFGITITFSSPDKKDFLQIVKLLADEYKIECDREILFKKAEAFAMLKGNRTPRTAEQFLTDYMSEIPSGAS